MSAVLAPDDEIGELVEAIRAERDDAPQRVDALIGRYRDDPRLHFMKGSLLAGSGRAIEAHRCLSRAVELAPDYSLARYQLGFFELTSGRPQQALRTWGPLLAEGEDSCFRKFVEGMTHLIRDEFPAAIARFEEGIALNRENEPINGDIRLLIGECRRLQDRLQGAPSSEHSATSVILGQFGGNKTIQ